MLRTGLIISLVGCILTGITHCQVEEGQVQDTRVPSDSLNPIDNTFNDKPNRPPVDTAGLTIVSRKDVTIVDPLETVAMESEVPTPTVKVPGADNKVDMLAKETNVLPSAESTKETIDNVDTLSNEANVLLPAATMTGILSGIEALVGETNGLTLTETNTGELNNVVADIQADVNELRTAFQDQTNIISSAEAVQNDAGSSMKGQASTAIPSSETALQDDITNVKDQTDILTNEAAASSQEAINTRRGSFIMPTNNVKLPRNTGTISSLENSFTGNLIESGPMGDTINTQNKNVLQTTSTRPTTAATAAATTAVAAATASVMVDTPSTQSTSSPSPPTTPFKTVSLPLPTASTPVVTGANVPSKKSSTKTGTSSIAFSTPTINDSTHGTVSPTVTNVGQTIPDDGTIVFKSRVSGVKQARAFTTTTAPAVDTGMTVDNNTTPQGNTTLNVIKPTTLRTTEMTQTEKATAPSNQTDTTRNTITESTTLNAPVSPVGEDNQAVKIVSNVVTTKPSPSSTGGTVENPTTNTPTTTTPTPIVTKQQLTETNSRSAVDNKTDKAVLKTTITAAPILDTVAADPDGVCPTIECTRPCPHGRKLDAIGCETCTCKFSADCPKPLHTTRLLCMMQIRMGQSCKTDAECPTHRICCPGSCGQSCHRRSTGRSRVLTMLRQF